MRAHTINEKINFDRDEDPRDTLGVNVNNLKQQVLDFLGELYDKNDGRDQDSDFSYESNDFCEGFDSALDHVNRFINTLK